MKEIKIELTWATNFHQDPVKIKKVLDDYGIPHKIKNSPENIDDDSGNFMALYLPKGADHFKVYELINNYEGEDNGGKR